MPCWAPAAGAAAGRTGRRTVPLRDGWRFALVDPGGITDPTGAYANAADPAYDDSAWRTVAVPRDWSIELAPTTDHGTTSGTGFFPGGRAPSAVRRAPEPPSTGRLPWCGRERRPVG
ncbi:hypothetical protein ACW4TU_03005 [Streptomyces sp. QTS52]